MWNKRLLALLAAALFTSATAVRAATEITGPHDNQTTGDGDGYDASAGSYDVPADTGGIPSATFNDNGNAGLGVGGPTTSTTIEGGQFDGNFNFGVDVGGGATVSISGGEFDSDGSGIGVLEQSLVTISGGQFLSDGYDLYDDGGTVALYGGRFDTDPRDTALNAFDGTIEVYGAFAGVAAGQTLTLPAGSGSFYAQLEDNSVAQTYSYFVADGGTITLLGTSTLLPEPATPGLIALAGAAVSIRRRRCAAVELSSPRGGLGGKFSCGRIYARYSDGVERRGVAPSTSPGSIHLIGGWNHSR